MPKIMFNLDLLIKLTVANRSSCLIGLFHNKYLSIVRLPENQLTMILLNEVESHVLLIKVKV